MPSNKQTFRAGVGALVLDNQDRILVFERKDIPAAWQLPQGGLKVDEEAVDAVYRELEEETGLQADDVELLFSLPRWTVYELPEQLRSTKTGLGQVHKWFVFRLLAGEEAITLGEGREFSAWQWIDKDRLPVIAVDFRKPVYEDVIIMLSSPFGSSASMS